MAQPKKVSVGLIQSSAAADAQVNLTHTLEQIRLCAQEGAKIICTQELFAMPYFCQTQDAANFELSETIPGGASTQTLSKLAAELQVVIIASLFERRMAGVYHNTAVIIDADGSVMGIYRKMHIPDDPEYYEKYYFTPGDLGYKVWQTRYAAIGVLICWDQWFPEAARATALQGADILFYPTAIAWHDHEYQQLGAKQHSAWETIQRSHAIANGVYVCAVNRTGREGQLRFWGQSFICDPWGVVLERAPSDTPTRLVRNLELSQNEMIRQQWPFLRDRRTDSYTALLQLGAAQSEISQKTCQ